MCRAHCGINRHECFNAGFRINEPADELVLVGMNLAMYSLRLLVWFQYQYGTLINITNKVFLNAKENVQ
jgi:hypothetical protein